jgi:hypothetical protein
MTARSARKLLAAWAAGRSYRKTTTARALRTYSRALKRLGVSGQLNWTKSARAWRWSWQLRGKSRTVGLRPGRLAWIAAGLALGEHFRKERAPRLPAPASTRRRAA